MNNTEEIWRPLNLIGFSYLYEMSSNGKVRYKEYKFWKDGILQTSKGRTIIQDEDKAVFLSNRRYQGMYNIGILYRHTFPNTKQ